VIRVRIPLYQAPGIVSVFAFSSRLNYERISFPNFDSTVSLYDLAKKNAITPCEPCALSSLDEQRFFLLWAMQELHAALGRIARNHTGKLHVRIEPKRGWRRGGKTTRSLFGVCNTTCNCICNTTRNSTCNVACKASAILSAV
jgi:hypothetical protein